MAIVPVLMVLYYDDSTEMRYSDGSKLLLSPCGSMFQFHNCPKDSHHPIQGVSIVQQRCPYVTSRYRQKVMEALDFRNRFTQMPYICANFYQKEDVVLLHSNIVQVTWPTRPKDAEVLPDGSIKLTSNDEFATVILSPHGRDVTVCYLSKTSTSSTENLRPKRQHSSPAECRSRHVSGGSNSAQSDGSSRSSNSTQHSKKSRSKHKLRGSQFGTLQVEPSNNSAFTKVPQKLLKHKRHSSYHGYPKYSDDEGSTNSFHSLDSVTSSVEDELCSSYRDLNIQSKAQTSQNIHTSKLVPKVCGHSRRTLQSNHLSLAVSPNISPISRELPTQYGPIGFVTEDALLGEHQSKSRQYYSWVTQHVSCCDCPLYWNHAVNLLKERWEKLKTGVFQSSVNGKERTTFQRATTPNEVASSFVTSELPPPVPLTCPGQHLHSWQSPTNLDSGTGQGQIKVIMSEGVIYRMVRLPSLRQVEVYPGDNSVIVSQGLTGHFFTHVLPRADNPQVYEKTYSVKVPPADYPGSPYSVSKLIKKGAQYFSYILPEAEGGRFINKSRCWQHMEEVTSVDLKAPSSLIKEEHNVPGLGKFLAFKNGKIRIVFADRTALDMVSHGHTPSCHGDHEETGDHFSTSSVYGSTKAKYWGELIPPGQCRLLLPSGQYQMVNLQHPGQYKKYIDHCLEWVDWTNTPIKDRANFYTDTSKFVPEICPDAELRKINCFNYVVENTVLKHQTLCNQAGDFSHFVSRDGLSHSVTSSESLSQATPSLDTIQSFDDVRRALQKTSQVIHDIDSLLSTRK